ncbi:uncharacterized protein LOC114177321 isoform X2 [Vigna unguiculata]|uniref:uncharacterized protein LOC114177321 isoform X2 n=1 Tax=Vigna unguiculata TaxID=3917 RepID=UPI0010163AA1|nr:uncharacterized protein LOC114177321 isoform X2 [Vigna unguiculata]
MKKASPICILEMQTFRVNLFQSLASSQIWNIWNFPANGSFSSFTPISFSDNRFLVQAIPISPPPTQKQNPSGQNNERLRHPNVVLFMGAVTQTSKSFNCY